MNDRIFAFMFIVIAFFVLGFTISRAVFKSPAPEEDASDTAAIVGQTIQEISEEAVSAPQKQEAVPNKEETSTTTKLTEESSAPKKDEITVTIKDTPTGWLNAREGPGITYKQIKRINPGETYELLEEKFGWYKIQLDAEVSGWIASQYAKKSN